MPDIDRQLLGIYLNDHLAGSAGGLALARRIVANHRETASAPDVQQLAEEIERDRTSLLEIMDRLRVSRARYKETAAVLAERVGRLKSNGRVWQRSPLSSLVEFEMLALGVTGKRAGWRSLRAVCDREPGLDSAELDALIARADEQLERIERLRTAAAVDALTTD